LSRFDRVIIADWSAAGTPSPARPSANAIWLGVCDKDGQHSQYHRTRASAETALRGEIAAALANSRRLLIGFDFPMGYPAGFAQRLTGDPRAQAVWAWLADHLQDAIHNQNNRFAVANQINQQFGGAGPFWGRPARLALQHLPMLKTVDYPLLGLAERRQIETTVPRAQPVWKLYTTGAAGSQGLVGQPMIHRLSQISGVSVWPFVAPTTPVLLAEVYPSLLAAAVTADTAPIKDEAQVRLLSRALYCLAQQDMSPLLATPPQATEEGWILGASQQAALLQALAT